MNIIFLHGLESTPETSSTAKLIKDNLGDMYTVHIPDYNPKGSYKNISKFLHNWFYDNKLGDEDSIVIGISLGGYWALKMTEFTTVNKVIVINPAIVKATQRYGVCIDTPKDVMGKMILNMDDDVVDNDQNFELYKNNFSIAKYPTGGHRATNKEEIMNDIEVSIDFLSVWIP